MTENDACTRISQCTIEFPETITAHMHLYCDDRYIRDSIISAEFVGSVTGLILLSILADRFGWDEKPSSYQLFIWLAWELLVYFNLFSSNFRFPLQNTESSVRRSSFNGLWRLFVIDGIIFLSERNQQWCVETKIFSAYLFLLVR